MAFIAYGIFLVWLVYSRFSRTVLKDEALSGKILALVCLLKLLAVPVYYLLYTLFYGGIEAYDSGVFFRDAAELNRFGREQPFEYLKALIGLQDDQSESFFFKHYISHSNNWDNGRIRVLFYNDNRIVIRVYSLLYFLSFGSYFVLALFSAVFSFFGSFWIYRAFKSYFHGKEPLLFYLICFFPSLWLHSGAVLKEGLAIFVLGANLLLMRRWIEQGLSVKTLLLFIPALFFAFLLKAYLLLPALLCFALLFLLDRSALRCRSLLFLLGLLLATGTSEWYFRFVKGHSMSQIATMRQGVFRDAAKGGIFLIDSLKFVRLEYNFDLVERVPGNLNKYRIKAGAPYVYWEHHHQQDTLICKANRDSLHQYNLAYSMPESRSNLPEEKAGTGVLSRLGQQLFHALYYPLWPVRDNPKLLLALFENLILLLASILALLSLAFSRKSRLLLTALISYALLEALLIAYTSPNTGAIIRYRAPAMIFLLMAAISDLSWLKARFRAKRN